MDAKLIIEQSLNASLLREKAMEELKPELANQYYAKMMECYNQLKDAQLLEEYRPLLYNSNSSVRLMAATNMLSIDEIVAREVITQIMEADGGEKGFTAKMILKEWDKGNMKEFR